MIKIPLIQGWVTKWVVICLEIEAECLCEGGWVARSSLGWRNSVGFGVKDILFKPANGGKRCSTKIVAEKTIIYNLQK